jgi:3-vinyl bacteriochlorophyllide hydratase
MTPTRPPNHLLYTPEQKIRRDASVWTLVQGILAPVQFLIFLISLWLVVRCLMTGEGENLALYSVVVKTIALYTIMVTGCIWEKVVFDQYLFAHAFFWEDVFSMLVLALAHRVLVGLVHRQLDGPAATLAGLGRLRRLPDQCRAVCLETACCAFAG